MNATNSIRNWPHAPAKPCGGTGLTRRSSPVFWRPLSLPIWRWLLQRSIRWKLVPNKSRTNGTGRLSGPSTKQIWPAVATKRSIQTTGWWPAVWKKSGMRSWLRWTNWSVSTNSCPNQPRCCSRQRNASRSAAWLMICQPSGMPRRQPLSSASNSCAPLSKMGHSPSAAMSSMWLFAGKLRLSRLFPFHGTRCRGKNARRAHTSSSVCGSGLQPIRRPRSRPCSRKRGCVQGWEAALPKAASIGFVLPIPFPSPARRGRDSVRADNEAMDGTQPWLRQNC